MSDKQPRCDKCKSESGPLMTGMCELFVRDGVRCGRKYSRCIDCGGVLGVKRSLSAHHTMYHAKLERLP